MFFKFMFNYVFVLLFFIQLLNDCQQNTIQELK